METTVEQKVREYSFNLSRLQREAQLRRFINITEIKEELKDKIDGIKDSDLLDIKGIGPTTVEKLQSKGYFSKEQLKKITEEELKKLDLGFFPEKAVNNFIKN